MPDSVSVARDRKCGTEAFPLYETGNAGQTLNGVSDVRDGKCGTQAGGRTRVDKPSLFFVVFETHLAGCNV